MKTPYMTGEEFAALIRARGWTQAEAAERLEVSLSSINKKCRGLRPVTRRDVLALRALSEKV